MTDRIVGLDKAESDLILNYLYDVYERNVDIQIRFRWTPGTSGKFFPLISFHHSPSLVVRYSMLISVQLSGTTESRSTMRAGTTLAHTLDTARASLLSRKSRTSMPKRQLDDKFWDCWVPMSSKSTGSWWRRRLWSCISRGHLG